ncbi:MAG: hypothetical protein FJ386_13315 [Verrucomicrobia bacterium]|nr:hypothetical protein [Verrucomicrobiota bacterium]
MNTHSPFTHSIRWSNLAAVCLCAFASIAMIGDLAGSRTLKGLGALSAAAPFPKVFCEFEGMEGFANAFTICYQSGGADRELALTPEIYSRLAGPYNRRNVYGAALAGGPKLPRPVWEAVFRHGFAPGGPLRRELGLPGDATNIRVVIQTKTRGRDDVWLLQPESPP